MLNVALVRVLVIEFFEYEQECGVRDKKSLIHFVRQILSKYLKLL